ncbi:MAG: T9SS type A sorting domain-containing protein [Flavobacterium sp.]|nr:T9SS type A sorting domain-containing protein [Flavobacterium sp.]
MKKIYLFSLVLIVCAQAGAQVINFPDNLFKQTIINNWNADPNGDGEVTQQEAATVTYIAVSNYNLTDLTGIEYFVNLTYLDCNMNNIASLDLSALSNLQTLFCSNSHISTLALPSSSALTTLSCNQNNLTELDLSAQSQLQTVNCAQNYITSLMLNNSPTIQTLLVNNNQLSSLDLSAQINLLTLYCNNNTLSVLDLSNQSSLTLLYCQFNNLTSLLLGSAPLQKLFCNNNLFTTLDVSNKPTITDLDCSYNSLTALNISGMTGLKIFSCDHNSITTLDFAGHPVLQNVKMQNNQLTSFSGLAGSTSIKTIVFENNFTQNVDLSNCPLAFQIFGNNSHIENFNISNCPLLSNVGYLYNPLKIFDIRNTAIGSVVISSITQLNGTLKIYASTTVNGGFIVNIYNDDNLEALDLTDCPNLTDVYLNNNAILKELFIKNGKNETVELVNNPALLYICADDSQVDSIAAIVDNLPNATVNSYCSFEPGGTFYAINGHATQDVNNNGCDVSDPYYPFLRLAVTGGLYSGNYISNTSGTFALGTSSGTTTITPVIENPSYYTIDPASVSVSFPSQTSPVTQNFCITPNGVHNDLEVSLLPVTAARPGFDANYEIICKNKGNVQQSGAVNFEFEDDKIDFISADLAPDVQTLNNLNWNFANLLPFETIHIKVKLNLNGPTETPAVNAGDVLHFAASVTGLTDETAADNVSTLIQTTVGAIDPNDKTCVEGATIGTGMAGKYVHYLIRFENTGTFAAENVVVKDLIDTTKFDVSSLVPLSSSHNFTTRITNTNKVEFIFENINLPFDDANNDGYVAFKIKTLPTLVNGDTFSNTASIYFDYNAPVLTNTATTAFSNLGTPDFAFEDYLTVYPNPAASVLNIKTKAEIHMASISIYNTLGQLVLVVPNAKGIESIDVSSLTAGNYFIKITSDKGSSTTRFVKN